MIRCYARSMRASTACIVLRFSDVRKNASGQAAWNAGVEERRETFGCVRAPVGRIMTRHARRLRGVSSAARIPFPSATSVSATLSRSWLVMRILPVLHSCGIGVTPGGNEDVDAVDTIKSNKSGAIRSIGSASNAGELVGQRDGEDVLTQPLLGRSGRGLRRWPCQLFTLISTNPCRLYAWGRAPARLRQSSDHSRHPGGQESRSHSIDLDALIEPAPVPLAIRFVRCRTNQKLLDFRPVEAHGLQAPTK